MVPIVARTKTLRHRGHDLQGEERHVVDKMKEPVPVDDGEHRVLGRERP